MRTFLLALVLLCPASLAQTTAPTSARDIDPRAALIEVVPPAAIVQSPAAVELTDRLMRKHVLLLQHPSLLSQVMDNPQIKKTRFAQQKGAAARLAGAIRVRVIGGTNLIEVMIDPDVAGNESPAVAEAIVNQHLENQRQIIDNTTLERSVMLNNLKQRYQFRTDELGRDLREKAVRLSIDGMGTPGRLSAREVELNNLLQLSFELERKKTEAAPEAVRALDAQLKQAHERIDAAKQDLGELTNAMNQYLTLKDDEATTRELLKSVNEQLDQLTQNMTTPRPEVRWLCRPAGG